MGTKQDGDPCYDAALDNEPMFVLLARDPQAPELIRKWARDREASGAPDQVMDDNGRWSQPPHPDADKIAAARYTAAKMEVWRYENDGAWRAKPDA